MNKGLELIEACWLFGVTPDDIGWLFIRRAWCIRWSSTSDGSVLAQLGQPGHAHTDFACAVLAERWESGVKPLDIVGRGTIDVRGARPGALSVFASGAACGARESTMPAILNAAERSRSAKLFWMAI